jgi:RHS repeat-associated protein
MDQVYDKDDDDVLEDPADGEDAWRVLSIYTHGPRSISNIVRNRAYGHSNKDATPEVTTNLYYFYDRMGNMLNAHYGAGYSTWDMDAYGNQTDTGSWPSIDSNGPKEKLTGKMLDDETGLYYFHLRWLDPEVGRFVSIDPTLSSLPHSLGSGGSAGDGCGGCRAKGQHGAVFPLQRPQNLNPYAYALNSPTNYVDPSGGCGDSPPDFSPPDGALQQFERLISKAR